MSTIAISTRCWICRSNTTGASGRTSRTCSTPRSRASRSGLPATAMDAPPARGRVAAAHSERRRSESAIRPASERPGPVAGRRGCPTSAANSSCRRPPKTCTQSGRDLIMSKLSIIMPVLNEGEGIAAALDALSILRSLGAEVMVVDGGSRDATIQRARLRADRVIVASPGRGPQMNAGAEKASGDVLLFLHVDTRLPADADHVVLNGLERSGRVWGRFDVEIEGRSSLLSVIAWMMNLRSCLTGIATGDQAMFVRRDAFRTAGGFAAIPLMEDIDLCKRLKRASRPLCLRERVVTSGRRWEKGGVLHTVVLMWRLRLAYFFGADPKELARRYGYE